MTSSVRVAMFGSSLLSAYWNGAATYYRGIIRALHDCGFDVTFYEPDAYDRQAHRDIEEPSWARVVVYLATQAGLERALEQASDADVLIKASGIGVFDAELEAALPQFRRAGNAIVFWDVDAPATLARMRSDPNDSLRAALRHYDIVLTYGGGPPVVNEYRHLGARECVPIYNALDPQTHHPVPPDPRFAGELGFLGNRLPDREARVREFLLRPAQRMPTHRFLLGGNGWHENVEITPNVRRVGHVYTRDHNAFNCSCQAVLNVNRESMASTGYSPPTRVFEAAGAAACLICDAWQGIEAFLDPGKEVLCACSGEDVELVLGGLTPATARKIGEAARRRVLAQHTYQHRAREIVRLFEGGAHTLSHLHYRPQVASSVPGA
jgi:spore maturation protein CgeB